MVELLSMRSAAAQMNNLTYSDYYYRLKLLATSVYKWNDLPNFIDDKWIENYLFEEGKCVFFDDDTIGEMVSKLVEGGMLNVYDDYTKVMPVHTQSTGKWYENHVDCVVIQNNDLCIPTKWTVQQYAYRLAEIQRTIDININAQKTPVLILADDKQKLSLKKVYEKWSGNEPVIFASKDLDTNPLTTLDTAAPIVFDKLELQKHCLWNECMTFLGVNNANQDKKERLVDDEVQANNEQIILNAMVGLKARQKAADEINRLFGTNITVELSTSYENQLEEGFIEYEDVKGADENELR